MSQNEVDIRTQIAPRKEGTTYIDSLSELRINKSVKSLPFRMYH